MSKTVLYEDMKNSGIKWIGAIPSHWQLHTLYQLVNQVKNKNSDLQETNLLSLSYGKIKRKDINTNDGLLPASFDGYNIIEAGDIVLRLTDLQNDHTSLRVGQATERGIITSAYTTLRPINRAHSRYLYYLLHAFDLKKGFYGMGSGVRQGLNYDEVKELRVILPPQEEQNTISNFLDEQSSKIDAIVDDIRQTHAKGQPVLVGTITIDSSEELSERLKKEGIRFIGTAIYTAMQGFLAAKCGAEYVAPYVNRIDNMGFDGVQVAMDIHDAITENGLDSGLLAASFKNSQQVLELIRYGVKAVTVAPDVIDGLVKNPAIDAAIDQFTKDFQGLVGEGKTMADC